MKKAQSKPKATIKSDMKQLQNRIRELESENENLKSQLSRFEELTSLVPDILFEIDFSGNVIYGNEEAYQLVGRSRDDLKHISSLLSPEDLKQYDEHVKLLKSGIDVGTNLYQIARPDGSTVQLMVKSRLMTKNNRPSGIQGIAFDITRQQWLEDLLRYSEMKYQLVMRSLKVAIAVIHFDGRFTFINEYGADQLGFKAEDIIGKTIWDFFPKQIADFEMDKVQRVITLEKEFQEEDKIIINNELRWYSILIQPYPNLQGKADSAIALAQNTTAQNTTLDKIKQSEEILRTIMDSSDESILLMDSKINCIMMNNSAVKRFGSHMIKFLNSPNVKTGKKYFPRELYLKRKSILSRVFRTGITIRDQDERDGIFFDTTYHPIFDADGKVNYIAIYARDITEIKKREIELEQSEQRLKTIIHNMPVMMDALGDSYQIVAWNRECERVTGYSAEEIIDNPKAFELLYPDEAYRKHIFDEWEQRGKNLRNLEWDITCKDGSIRTIAWSNIADEFPISGWNSWATGVDVTERKRIADQRLQQSKEYYSLLLENSLDMVIVIDRNGKIRYCNPSTEKTYGYKLEELIGHYMFEYITTEDIPAFQSIWEQLISNPGVAIVIESRVPHRDGSWCYIEAKSIYLPENPSIDAIIINARDITSRREADEQLKKAKAELELHVQERTRELMMANQSLQQKISELETVQKEKQKLLHQLIQVQKMEAIGRLTGGIAHDFNNLLSPILGYAGMILTDYPKHDPLYQQVENIHFAARKARDLIKQLLAFSRKQVLQMSVIDLNAEIDKFRNILRYLIRIDIEIDYQLGEDIGFIKADQSQIHQILMNLTLNAQDALPDGGRLRIETSAVLPNESFYKKHFDLSPGRYILLNVIDNGIGMSEETLGMIFEPFFTTKEHEKGTGLGLPTVYGIVKQHQGTIEVISAPQQGTTVSIYFPCVDEIPDVNEDRVILKSKTTQGETILVVEDEDSVREVIDSILRDSGYQMILTKDPYEALKWVREKTDPIHLLITDVILPRMNGKELYQKISALRENIKILFISGYSNEIISNQGILEHGVQFLPKPFSVEDLRFKVREILDRPL